MSTPLEHYALLSDLRTGPLVSRDGSIDWLCLPRYDSPAVFTALLGGPDDGRWKLSIRDGAVTARRYIPHTFVLETTWQSPTGTARVTDFLPIDGDQGDLIRRVRCLEGSVTIEHDLRLRFDYAQATPWTRQVETDGNPAFLAVAGPDGLLITGPDLSWPDDDDAPDPDENGDPRGQPGARYGSSPSCGGPAPTLVGSTELDEGESVGWDLTWFPSHLDLPTPPDAERAYAECVEFWTGWTKQLDLHERHPEEVLRSLLVLRALTHKETGGIVAAPTASLPELFGGERNWDYRYTWLRDASLTIEVAVAHGLTDGAALWRDWLLRAVAGDAADVKIMYGLSGERDLAERELDHLAGYENSTPVRIGNAAVDQFQADVVGEVMLALHRLREGGAAENEYTWGLQRSLLRYCEENLERKDHGIWEMRGDPHYFTHGRVMMWAAFDRGVRAVQEYGLDGPVERWQELRQRLAEEIEAHGFDTEVNSYTQTYDNDEADASLLQLPHTGYLSYDDPRMLGTVAHIEKHLATEGGWVHRYRPGCGMDGLSGGESPFVLCTLWLVEQYARSARVEEAEALMARVLAAGSDLGLFAEQYDPVAGRQTGNFPQAFSHIGVIRAADAIHDARETGPGSAPAS